MNPRVLAITVGIVALAALAVWDRKEPGPPAPAKAAAQAQPAAAQAPAADLQPNPERNAYFGETHIHTSWSVDAWVMGNRLTGPDDALKYAQGQTIKHPLGYDIKIDTPMDFMGVTDHSEYVGVTREANIPGILREQASRGEAPHHEGSEQRRRAEPKSSRTCSSSPGARRSRRS